MRSFEENQEVLEPFCWAHFGFAFDDVLERAEGPAPCFWAKKVWKTGFKISHIEVLKNCYQQSFRRKDPPVLELSFDHLTTVWTKLWSNGNSDTEKALRQKLCW